MTFSLFISLSPSLLLFHGYPFVRLGQMLVFFGF
jgi:hypothetical protein